MSATLEELERVNRLYAALRDIHRAVVEERTREGLTERVCEVLVAKGGFRMAWVGWLDAETQRLVPIATAGDDGGYLQRVEVYADERAQGRGPAGRAFCENRPYICNDVFIDPAMAPWRTEIERQGYRASAALPIRVDGAPVGVLTVYAAAPGFFRDQEVTLLAEAAEEISFALYNLANEAARRAAEASVQRLAAIVESTDDAIFSETRDGLVTSWNPAAERMFGYAATEMRGTLARVLVPPEHAAEDAAFFGRIEGGERIEPFESTRLRKDRTHALVSIAVSGIWVASSHAAGKELAGLSKIVRDIGTRKRAEAVAEREQRLAASLVEAMPSIFYMYDESGRFLRWNRNFERVSGRAAQEIAVMHPLDLFIGAEKELVRERIAEVFERGHATVEAALLSKDGTATPYFLTGKCVELEGKRCLVGVGVDISERNRAVAELGRSEERYRSTLDTILEGCQIIGFDWRYLYLNPAAATQNRRPNGSLLGRSMQQSWPGIETSEVFALLHRCMEERIAVHGEARFQFADGHSGWFDVRVQPVPEGIFVLSIDISERKEAERALRELNRNLERIVENRTRDLLAARERAESADRLKSAFLATMSHELRTPLNSILGFTSIVANGMAGPLNAEQTKQLGMVLGSSRHLLDLINDILDLSKIEAGQLELRPTSFDLRASVVRVTDSVRPMLEKKGLTLGVDLPPDLGDMVSDRRRVEQILLNLLNNAIKFTDRGGVKLTLAVVADTGAANAGTLRIAVADTGIGIAAADLSLLFQPFRQIDSGLQRQHEGTGLGLAICRRLTTLLGGSIGAESTAGAGSVFTVTLPLSLPEATRS